METPKPSARSQKCKSSKLALEITIINFIIFLIVQFIIFKMDRKDIRTFSMGRFMMKFIISLVFCISGSIAVGIIAADYGKVCQKCGSLSRMAVGVVDNYICP